MGTSGTLTIIFKKQYYITYNHCDAYLDSMGKQLVTDIKHILKEYGMNWLMAKVVALKAVNNTIPPTENQILALAEYTDLSVSTQSDKDWYCLLRGTQGSLFKMLSAGYYMEYNADEDYNYVIDLDEKQFWLKEDSHRFNLNNIPDNWINDISYDEIVYTGEDYDADA